jgi:hypothetical protein
VHATGAGTDSPTEQPVVPAPVAAVRRSGAVRVALVAIVGALLVGCAGFAASLVLTPDAPLPQTMCVDSTCTYAMSAGGAPVQPVRQHSRSAPERFVRKVLYICHLGGN